MKKDYVRPLLEVSQVNFGAALLEGSPEPTPVPPVTPVNPAPPKKDLF